MAHIVSTANGDARAALNLSLIHICWKHREEKGLNKKPRHQEKDGKQGAYRPEKPRTSLLKIGAKPDKLA